MVALRPFFPRDKFRKDVEQRGSVEVLAARAGMGKGEPYAWRAERATPRAERLTTFLTANNIPLEAYRDYLERAASTVTAVCSASRRSSKCRREWTMHKRQVGALNKRRRQRGLSPLMPKDGKLHTPCAACVRAEVGRRALGSENDDRFAGLASDERPGIVADSMGGQHVLKRNWDSFRTMIRKPKSDAHRDAIARARVAVALRKGFRFCHLCELAVHEQHGGKRCDRPHFHRMCLLAFRRWFSKKNGRQPAAHELPGPPRPDKRGPKPEHKLLRNYEILTAWARGKPAAVRAIRKREHFDSRGTVTEARQTFLRYAAGSWDLMFSKTKRIRAANSFRQELVPLPKSLERELKSGSRDALLVRLWAFAMPLDDIAAVTGADHEQIARVTRDLTSDDLEGARKKVLDRCNPTPSVAPDRRAPPTSSSRVHRAPINLKLTPERAQDIVDAPAERGVNARKAREYGLSPGYVSAIRKGHTVWPARVSSTTATSSTTSATSAAGYPAT